nr:MAG TPA: hypothetical protein [Caudoviricetes sp.]
MGNGSRHRENVRRYTRIRIARNKLCQFNHV